VSFVDQNKLTDSRQLLVVAGTLRRTLGAWAGSCAFALVACSSTPESGSTGSSGTGSQSSTTGTGGTGGEAAGSTAATSGAQSSSNGGAGASINITTGAGGGNGQGGETACAAESHQATQKPLAMYLIVDQSNSMSDPDEEGAAERWTPVSTAIRAFVEDPTSAGIEVGLGYFPYPTSEVGDASPKCEPASYETPDVPIALLPDNAAVVTASLDARMYTPGQRTQERGDTPTRPAYEGSATYLSSWLTQYPDHVGVLILATDGQPFSCQQNAIQDIADLIAANAAATPAVKTYVIGIGLVDNLDQLAQAGDTGYGAFIVDGTGANIQTQFLQAMQEIRGAALPCNYDIPPSTGGGRADPEKVNVDFTGSDGMTATPLYKAADASACASTPDGWYYDDPTAPTSIVLCPDTCTRVSGDVSGSVGIVLGCQTRVR